MRRRVDRIETSLTVAGVEPAERHAVAAPGMEEPITLEAAEPVPVEAAEPIGLEGRAAHPGTVELTLALPMTPDRVDDVTWATACHRAARCARGRRSRSPSPRSRHPRRRPGSGCWRSCSSRAWLVCSSSTPWWPSCSRRTSPRWWARAPWPTGWAVSPGGWLAPTIFVNDLVLGLGLVGAIWARHAVRAVILAWAGVWFFVVTLVKLTALNPFP